MGTGASITGIGYTAFARKSGKTVLELATEACLAAIEDSGVPIDAIEGLATFHLNDSARCEDVATQLNLGPLAWINDWLAGGAAACATIGDAARVINSGTARHVLVYRAMNGASGIRMGSFGSDREAAGVLQFTNPYGYMGSPVQMYALPARRHMHEFGTTQEQLGAIAVTQRRHANLNPRAILHGKTLSMDEYLASRPIVDPLRLYDCCQETDGAVALVISADAEVGGLRHRPIRVAASAFAMAPFAAFPYEKYASWTTMFPKWLAARLFAEAGLTPADISLVNLYDAFSFVPLCQLEDFGFCEKGEGGPFVASGAIALDGALPLNTHGGLLSEGYIHGLNSVTEAVIQLRHDAGQRQVNNAQTALVSGFGFSRGSAVILTR